MLYKKISLHFLMKIAKIGHKLCMVNEDVVCTF